MNDIMMEVSTPKELVFAICFARNAFLKSVKICVDNTAGNFNKTINEDIQDAITGMYSLECGYFSTAQTKSYAFEILFDASGSFAQIYLKTDYMSSEKECNDFTCIAAEISELLLTECGLWANDFQKIAKFSSWVKKNFDYKITNTDKDYSAVELLRNRTGVCQAVAALAVKVLPYMGIETQYISGQGYETSGWGKHAWNIVKTDGRWIHVDFTFALNSLLVPMTDNSLNLKMFKKTHQWNSDLLSEAAIAARSALFHEIEKSEILLIENEKYFMIHGVKIFTETPIYMNTGNKEYISIGDLIHYLGGACELNPSSDTMRICVGSQIMTLNHAVSLLNPDIAAFDRSILDVCGIRNVKYGNKLMLTFAKTALWNDNY